MDINDAKNLKKELELKIAELLKGYEHEVGVEPYSIGFVRQPTSNNLGIETDYNYAVEVKVML